MHITPFWLSWTKAAGEIVPEWLVYGAGLIALADIPSLARKTALWGVLSPFDVTLIAPGLHKQKDLDRLSNGEYPACAAMTTGYVFRVENEAMVHYMQRVGRPGQLTTLSVTPNAAKSTRVGGAKENYTFSIIITPIFMALTGGIDDMAALAAMTLLLLVSICNALLFRRRLKEGWKGQKEPGVKSDLLVLMSQDRWIRLQGMTDDVKVVTSGQWLRQPYAWEDSLYSLMSLVVYLSAGIMFAASHEGKLIFVVMMLLNTILLETLNARTNTLLMYGRLLSVVGRKAYGRRLDMAEELVKETGKDEWCEKMGIILTKSARDSKGRGTGAAIM